jgi:DNA-binding XRE family transcriptional regulator
MSVNIEKNRPVNNWNLAIKLFKWLPPGTYYLTLVTPYEGGKQGPTQICLVAEVEEGRLYGMPIEEPIAEGDYQSLKSYAEALGFRQHTSPGVFILQKN